MNIDGSAAVPAISIQDLVQQIAPGERVDPEVEALLLQVADEFVNDLTTWACRLAKHRKANTVEAKDVQTHLRKQWNISVPGFSETTSGQRFKKTHRNLEVHRARMEAIKTEQKHLDKLSRTAPAKTKKTKKRKR